MGNIARLRNFVQDMTELVTHHPDNEEAALTTGRRLLSDLICHDDWLPDKFARPHPDSYRQYLLYCDPLERFSVVSFVWGSGHTTPIHDHTVWGLVGVMRGAERCEEYARSDASGHVEKTGEHVVSPGEIDAVSPAIGDIHVVSNGLPDGVSVSIHVYGANIGAVRRHTFDIASAVPVDFVSGYANEVIPNLWDRSTEAMAGE